MAYDQILNTSLGIGQYVASEIHSAAWGRVYHKGALKRAVVFFQGLAGGNTIYVSSPNFTIARECADRALPMMGAQYGIDPLWGNSTAQTRIGEVWTFAKTFHDAKTDKVVLVGESKGAAACLNWAMANRTSVAALALTVPAVDLQNIYDAGGANATQIGSAYGGAPGASFNPASYAASAAGLNISIWYSGDDTTILPTTVSAFAERSGASAYNVGNVGHAGWASMPAASIAAFIASNV